MLYLVMESGILMRHIHSHVYVDKKAVTLVCTNGFIYNYKRKSDGSVDVTLNSKSVYDKLIKYKEGLKPGDEVVIATDHDKAGELIALEALSIFPNAKRYRNRIDDMLYEPELVVKAVLYNSSEKYFCKDMAMAYLEEKLSGANERAERMRVLERILSRDSVEGFFIPPRYARIIEAL